MNSFLDINIIEGRLITKKSPKMIIDEGSLELIRKIKNELLKDPQTCEDRTIPLSSSSGDNSTKDNSSSKVQ